MNQDKLEQELLDYIRVEFLFGDEDEELETTTPLLEWGILDSLRTALLMTHIREAYAVFISPVKIQARNFRDIRTIAGLVLEESTAAAGNSNHA